MTGDIGASPMVQGRSPERTKAGRGHGPLPTCLSPPQRKEAPPIRWASSLQLGRIKKGRGMGTPALSSPSSEAEVLWEALLCARSGHSGREMKGCPHQFRDLHFPLLWLQLNPLAMWAGPRMRPGVWLDQRVYYLEEPENMILECMWIHTSTHIQYVYTNICIVIYVLYT